MAPGDHSSEPFLPYGRQSIEEADIARQVELLDERDRKRRMGKLPSPPSARHLDDGIQGDIPIEDLMKGLKGFL